MIDLESLEKYKLMMNLREELKRCTDNKRAIEIQAKLIEITLDAVKDEKFKEFLAKQSKIKKGV